MPARLVLGLGAVLLAAGVWASGRVAVGDVQILAPRGIRNHNPGNLRASADQWLGQVGADAGGYVIFERPEFGLRALAIVLTNYERLHGIDTLAELVARYAPAGDGNDEGAYVAHLAERLGISPNESFSITARLPELMRAIIRHENGRQPYSVARIEAAAGEVTA